MLTRGQFFKGGYKVQAERAKRALAAVKEKGEETVGLLIQSVEVSGSAFGFAYANSAYGNGELKVFGLPADLAAGVGLHAVALLDGLGKYGEHGHNVADGCLASYAARKGAAMGTEKAQSNGPGWISANAQQQMGGGAGWISANANQQQQQPQGGTGWIDANANREAA